MARLLLQNDAGQASRSGRGRNRAIRQARAFATTGKNSEKPRGGTGGWSTACFRAVTPLPIRCRMRAETIPISWELTVPTKLPPHVKMVRNKIGRPYLYLMRHRGTRRAERAVRLPDDARSPEFWAEYARLMQIVPLRPNANAVSALISAWQASPEWEHMSPRTRGEWQRHCGRIEKAWGHLEARGIEPKHALALRDQFQDRPEVHVCRPAEPDNAIIED